jgi:hypothetical protein
MVGATAAQGAHGEQLINPLVLREGGARPSVWSIARCRLDGRRR